ncbi:MAG: tripartite tricarboxylate transporter substrate binding protein [Rhizobiales bacterium]|nr:tripartite tricarboxylate transporter substrate binding protein [Hyphomicrobiales bacterium]
MTPRSCIPIIAALAVIAAEPAQAQPYPSQPVTIVVPFAAGGGSDLLARLVAQKLEQRLGQSFVIENRPGGGTTLAATAVARAKPDGYTLMQATSTTMAISVTMVKKLGYDPVRDFVPVALLTASPFVLTVSADSPVKSVADLIAFAKAKPGELNYGSAGPGSMHHLSTELMLSLTGTRMQHVPYKATPPALTDLLAGRLQVLFGDGPSVVPQIREGKLRALAVSTAKRSAATPDVPTMQEAGIAGFESAAWQMLIAPTGTPSEIVSLLNKEVRAVFSEAEVKEELLRRGMGPQMTPSPEQLRNYVKDEIARWSPIVKRAGVAGTR